MYDVVSYFTMIISFHYIVFIRMIDYKTIFPKLNRFSHGKMMWAGVFDPIHGLGKIQMAPSILACAQIPTLQKKNLRGASVIYRCVQYHVIFPGMCGK